MSYLKKDTSFAMVASAYRGTAYSSDDSRYEKATLDKIIEEKHPDVKTKNGWVAMIQHYFVSAWIGDDDANVNNIIYSQASNNDTAAIIGIRMKIPRLPQILLLTSILNYGLVQNSKKLWQQLQIILI